jgi:hypothetical protein
MHLLQKNEVL